MNRRDTQLEVMRRCLDGEASEEEFAQLEELLRNDSEFRKDYLRYLTNRLREELPLQEVPIRIVLRDSYSLEGEFQE